MIPGYSKKAINLNIETLYRHGYSRAQSIAKALAFARVSFFKRNPSKLLPMGLAQKQHQKRDDYDNNGFHKPRSDYARMYESQAHAKDFEPNPVLPLSLNARQQSKLMREVNNKFSGTGQLIRKAATLFSEFTGHEANLETVSAPEYPKVLMNFGDCDAIKYTTIRDGVTEHYEHTFKKSARPMVCVSPDGKQIVLLGGNFQFDERGIVDK